MLLSPQNSHVEILMPPGHTIRGESWLNHKVGAFIVALMLLKRDPGDLPWDNTGKEHHLLPQEWTTSACAYLELLILQNFEK